MYAVLDMEAHPPVVVPFEGGIESVLVNYKNKKIKNVRVVETDAQANSLKEKWRRDYEQRQTAGAPATAAPN